MMWKENTVHRKKRKTERERTKKREKNKGEEKESWESSLEVRAPAVLVFFIYFAFDYATSRILFLSPFSVLLVQIFMRD